MRLPVASRLIGVLLTTFSYKLTHTDSAIIGTRRLSHDEPWNKPCLPWNHTLEEENSMVNSPVTSTGPPLGLRDQYHQLISLVKESNHTFTQLFNEHYVNYFKESTGNNLRRLNVYPSHPGMTRLRENTKVDLREITQNISTRLFQNFGTAAVYVHLGWCQESDKREALEKVQQILLHILCKLKVILVQEGRGDLTATPLTTNSVITSNIREPGSVRGKRYRDYITLRDVKHFLDRILHDSTEDVRN